MFITETVYSLITAEEKMLRAYAPSEERAAADEVQYVAVAPMSGAAIL